MMVESRLRALSVLRVTLCNLNFVQIIVWVSTDCTHQSRSTVFMSQRSYNSLENNLLRTAKEKKRERAVVSWSFCNSPLHQITIRVKGLHSAVHHSQVFLPFAALGQRQRGLSRSYLNSSSSSLCDTPGTSIELMMPHEDERNAPEEKIRFFTNRRITALKQYHRQHSKPTEKHEVFLDVFFFFFLALVNDVLVIGTWRQLSAQRSTEILPELS